MCGIYLVLKAEVACSALIGVEVPPHVGEVSFVGDVAEAAHFR